MHYSINDLRKNIGTYLQLEQINKIQLAYQFSAEAHKGQTRKSGEPYIYHPIMVAHILADMRMDHQSLMAALLHDVIEDTPTAKKDIRKKFGKEVSELVDGVSKLSQIQFESAGQAQTHNLCKMLMAMSRDIRVVLIKLADRLHNMRTLSALNIEKRKRIARETLEVYAPIALRLGIHNIRLELEELSFANLYPNRYQILNHHIANMRGHRKTVLQKIQRAIKRRLRQEKIAATISGREKHLFGIYEKMRTQRIPFDKVFDVYAFRIIVDNVDTCYRVIGSVHSLYKPVPGRFKDYIAIPKVNGYQSLHTTLFGPHQLPIEVQVRTSDMDNVAEAGVAAHWLYKTSERSIHKGEYQRAKKWLRSIIELQKTTGNTEEFYEHVKIDLFPDEVYVFTPQSEIIKLPINTTGVDFAYAIHSDIGNHCVGVRINRQLKPLDTLLNSGDTVDVITAPNAKPDPNWLNFVVTAKARSQIRHYLKSLQRDEAIELGRRLLDRELEKFHTSTKKISEDQWQTYLQEYKYDSQDNFYAEVGLGNRIAPLVARQIINDELVNSADLNSKPLAIQGTEGMIVQFPKCCYPIPGDTIRGFISAGRGLVIHRQDCKNVTDSQQKEKWINVNWSDEISQHFKTHIKVDVLNQRGVLARISVIIADADTNIENVNTTERDDRYMTLSFLIEVKDRIHLAQVMKNIRHIKNVVSLSRQ